MGNQNEYVQSGTELVQTANAALQSIPFGNLIGAPLEACVNAQAQAARTTYEYISEVGFDVKSEYEWEARTVSFTFMMEGVMKQITVPLLTILPLPYLQIDTVDISFTADVSVNSEGKMMAKVSNATDSEAVKQSSLNFQSQIGIDIKASSAGNMPVGIAKLLDILGNSCIEVIEVEDEKDEAEAEETPEAEKPEGDKPREAEAVAKTELYNVVLDKKPNKSQLAKVVAAIVSGSGGIVTEESVMNAIQNSTNMTVLTSVKKEVADNVISAAEAVGGKLRKILIG
ncbi:MAG: DUF2589 domain-containing protein [Bacteroidales bacterium]|nr:DUF2589 domain-containing protein [Bacteroidales bacterium]